MIEISSTEKLLVALKTLTDANILSAPVFDANFIDTARDSSPAWTRKYIGMIDTQSILVAVLDFVGTSKDVKEVLF
jgi:hypothetical protein